MTFAAGFVSGFGCSGAGRTVVERPPAGAPIINSFALPAEPSWTFSGANFNGCGTGFVLSSDRVLNCAGDHCARICGCGPLSCDAYRADSAVRVSRKGRTSEIPAPTIASRQIAANALAAAARIAGLRAATGGVIRANRADADLIASLTDAAICTCTDSLLASRRS